MVLGTLTQSDKRVLLQLARESVTAHLSSAPAPPAATNTQGLRQPRASFVTLWEYPEEALRGCRGETRPTRPLAESVATMAISAAVDDQRFAPVQQPELDHLRFEVSALSAMQPIEPQRVDVTRHGLLIRRGEAGGLLLPGTPQRYGWDRLGFLAAVSRKAGDIDDMPANAEPGPQVQVRATGECRIARPLGLGDRGGRDQRPEQGDGS